MKKTAWAAWHLIYTLSAIACEDSGSITFPPAPLFGPNDIILFIPEKMSAYSRDFSDNIFVARGRGNSPSFYIGQNELTQGNVTNLFMQFVNNMEKGSGSLPQGRGLDRQFQLKYHDELLDAADFWLRARKSYFKNISKKAKVDVRALRSSLVYKGELSSGISLEYTILIERKRFKAKYFVIADSGSFAVISPSMFLYEDISTSERDSLTEDEFESAIRIAGDGSEVDVEATEPRPETGGKNETAGDRPKVDAGLPTSKP